MCERGRALTKLGTPLTDRLLNAMMRGADVVAQVSTREGYEISASTSSSLIDACCADDRRRGERGGTQGQVGRRDQVRLAPPRLCDSPRLPESSLTVDACA